MGDNSIRKVALPLEFILKEAIPRQFLGLNHFQEAESNIRFLFLFFSLHFALILFHSLAILWANLSFR